MERFPRPSRMDIWPRVFHEALIVAVALLAFWASGAFTPFAPGISVDKILSLRGESFLQAVERAVPSETETRFSPTELIKILKRFPMRPLAEDPEELRWAYAFSNVYDAACILAGPEQVDDLVAEANSPRKALAQTTVLSLIANPWVRREMHAIQAEHPPAPVFAPADDELPESLQAAPAELQTAWHGANAVLSRYTAFRSHAEEDEIPAGVNFEEFEHLIEQVLAGNGRDASRRLCLFKSESWCGTCQDQFTVPRDLAIFMGLLRERRIAEAAGAALFVRGEPIGGIERLDGDLKLRRQLWEMCGLDWEALAVGILLDDNRHEWSNTVPANHLPELLGVHGSVKGARLFAAALPFIGREHVWNVNHALELFLTQPEASEDPGTDAQTARSPRRKEPLPDSVQRELVQSLVASIQNAKDFDRAEELAGLLESVKRRDFVPLLRPLLWHHSENVAELAEATLHALGEKALRPVRIESLGSY